MNDAQRYPAQVFYSDEDEGFIAIATDLPGCSAFGETQEEAVAELRDAIDAWQIAAKNAGNPIPEPSKQRLDDLPSGRILLRLPRTLHAQLIERAKHEHVSLNQHLVFVLTASTSSSVRSAVLDHGEMFWSRTLSGANLMTLNYSGEGGIIMFHTPTRAGAVNWYESSSKSLAPKLVGYSSIEEAANG